VEAHHPFVPKTSVLLVDDSPIFLEHLRAWLSRQDGVDIVGCARSGAEAVALASELQPEVVLMDVAMPEMSGFQAARHLKLLANAPAVLILTLEPAYRAAAVAAGAEGFLCKSNFEDELLPMLRRLRRQK
jgi:DNA-binding NarL/FixJ family response regulator